MDKLKKMFDRRPDRVGAILAVIVGIICLAVGYDGVYHTLDTGEQLPYVVSGGIMGIFLLGLGAVLWVSASLKDEAGKLEAAGEFLRTSGTLPDPAPVESRREVEVSELS